MRLRPVSSIATLLLACGCTCESHVDQKTFACVNDGDCADGFVCVAGECARSGAAGGAEAGGAGGSSGGGTGTAGGSSGGSTAGGGGGPSCDPATCGGCCDGNFCAAGT